MFNQDIEASFISHCYNSLINQGLTPEVIVELGAGTREIHIPNHLKNGTHVVFSLGPSAVSALDMDCKERYLSFAASFQGKQSIQFIPFENIVAFRSKENPDCIISKPRDNMAPIKQEVKEEKKEVHLEVVAFNKDITPVKSKAPLVRVK